MKILFSACFLMFALNLFSQKDSMKIEVHDAFNANQTIDPASDISYPGNLVKWNIGMLVRGAFEMDYERCVSEKFTMEIGAGVTYYDVIYSVFSSISNDESSDFISLEKKYGPLVSASIRFFPDGVTGFDGFFVSIPLRYRRYNAIEEVTYSNSANGYNSVEVTQAFKNSHSHFEYGFTIGTQTSGYSSLMGEYYLGVGLNSLTSTYPAFNINGIPFQYNESKVRPMLLFGFKIGLAFK